MKRELQNREIYQAYDHMNRHDYFQSSYSIPEHLGTGFIHCYAIPWGIVIGEFFMQYRQDMVGGGSLGGAAAMFALNFIIGGFVLVWRLLVAMWYVSLTIYRLIVGY